VVGRPNQGFVRLVKPVGVHVKGHVTAGEGGRDGLAFPVDVGARGGDLDKLVRGDLFAGENVVRIIKDGDDGGTRAGVGEEYYGDHCDEGSFEIVLERFWWQSKGFVACWQLETDEE